MRPDALQNLEKLSNTLCTSSDSRWVTIMHVDHKQCLLLLVLGGEL